MGQIERHTTIHFGVLPRFEDFSDGDKGKFKCPLCWFSTWSEKGAKAHANTEHHKCGECGSYYLSYLRHLVWCTGKD